MRKGKWSLILIAALALSLGLAAATWAQPGHGGGWGGGCGMWGGNLTPEQAGKMFDLKQKFMNDTADLRKQMMVKQAELSALWRTENPNEQQIAAKQKEINAIRDQLQQKRNAFRLEARKVTPHMGYGPGGEGCPMMGAGPGAGPGPGPAGGPPPAPAGK